jgi:uncharacterized membrane protein YqiK
VALLPVHAPSPVLMLIPVVVILVPAIIVPIIATVVVMIIAPVIVMVLRYGERRDAQTTDQRESCYRFFHYGLDPPT